MMFTHICQLMTCINNFVSPICYFQKFSLLQIHTSPYYDLKKIQQQKWPEHRLAYVILSFKCKYQSLVAGNCGNSFQAYIQAFHPTCSKWFNNFKLVSMFFQLLKMIWLLVCSARKCLRFLIQLTTGFICVLGINETDVREPNCL